MRERGHNFTLALDLGELRLVVDDLTLAEKEVLIFRDTGEGMSVAFIELGKMLEKHWEENF